MRQQQHKIQRGDRRSFCEASTIVLVIHGVLMLVLAGFVISQPCAAKWISDAVQAEFVGPGALN